MRQIVRRHIRGRLIHPFLPAPWQSAASPPPREQAPLSILRPHHLLRLTIGSAVFWLFLSAALDPMSLLASAALLDRLEDIPSLALASLLWAVWGEKRSRFSALLAAVAVALAAVAAFDLHLHLAKLLDAAWRLPTPADLSGIQSAKFLILACLGLMICGALAYARILSRTYCERRMLALFVIYLGGLFVFAGLIDGLEAAARWGSHGSLSLRLFEELGEFMTTIAATVALALAAADLPGTASCFAGIRERYP